uniref:Uncharacterized protein n=1 Tax=Aegilops tauschii subsp. strangulata TaxID=200361 RepID=A0A453IJV5_AEGTS
KKVLKRLAPDSSHPGDRPTRRPNVGSLADQCTQRRTDRVVHRHLPPPPNPTQPNHHERGGEKKKNAIRANPAPPARARSPSFLPPPTPSSISIKKEASRDRAPLRSLRPFLSSCPQPASRQRRPARGEDERWHR